jgi:hypothetical protein
VLSLIYLLWLNDTIHPNYTVMNSPHNCCNKDNCTLLHYLHNNLLHGCKLLLFLFRQRT